jgi:undecaprenyl-diphosphatase
MVFIDNILGLPLPILNPLGYVILLFVTFFEVSPLFGLLIPGQTIVITGGFLAHLGILDFFDTLFVSMIGAVLGDIASFWLGRKYGFSFITKYGKYFFFKRSYFEKATRLIDDHTGKSLIIGRFHSITRSFAPFIAGASNIKFFTFLFYCVIGCFSWALCFFLIGYIFGASYSIAARYFETISLALIFIILALFYWVYKKTTKPKTCL